ncbi:sulfite exporter TauE/SafE family protein [Treponema sp. OttesenSCG-928-L16]|nr:sulfite exporter TauE/SafE family protein [Treponema sp. OttesenSCG-928-L16]
MVFSAFFLISFFASVVGAICGIGGGIIIKPVLDLFKLADISVISFFSICTVLAMTSYSAAKTLISREGHVNIRLATPMALGSVAGGILGQRIFLLFRTILPDPGRVGAVQAVGLSLVTLGTLVYTLRKSSIRTLRLSGRFPCFLIGLFLGCVSNFLGIGGGPINLVALYYFFSLNTKEAVTTSLYLIFFGHVAGILSIVLTGSVPAFNPLSLAVMIAGGLGGGIAGSAIHRRIAERAVERLFIAVMVFIILIGIYNSAHYLGFAG